MTFRPIIRYFPLRPNLRPFITNIHYLAADVKEWTTWQPPERGVVKIMLRGSARVRMGDREFLNGSGAYAVGPRFGTLRQTVYGPIRIVGFGLTPLGWRSIFGVDADELSDQVLSLGDLIGREAEDLFDRLLPLIDGQTMSDITQAYIGRWLGRHAPRKEWFPEAVTDWLVSGDTSMDRLVETVDLSKRQTVRLSRAYFGAPPIRLVRRARVKRAALAMIGSSTHGGEFAHSQGFSDQSHFIREFKSFMGQTPSDFRRELLTHYGDSVRQRQTLGTSPSHYLV